MKDENINYIWSSFNKKMDYLQGKHVPKRVYIKKGCKGNFPLDEGTRALITRKHALSGKSASSNTDENRMAYNKMRNKVSNEVKKKNKEKF